MPRLARRALGQGDPRLQAAGREGDHQEADTPEAELRSRGALREAVRGERPNPEGRLGVAHPEVVPVEGHTPAAVPGVEVRLAPVAVPSQAVQPVVAVLRGAVLAAAHRVSRERRPKRAAGRRRTRRTC